MAKHPRKHDWATEPVRLGVLVPMTGAAEMYASDLTRAADLAVRRINAAGGVLGRPLMVQVENDGSEPGVAVPAAVKLLDTHDCVALIGCLLGNARQAVAHQVSEVRRVPLLNFSFSEGSVRSPYFFQFAALPNQHIEPMIPEIVARHGPKVFFAGSNYDWARGSIGVARGALLEAGGEVVGESYLPLGRTCFDTLLGEAARSGADVLMPFFPGADQVAFLRRFGEQGLKGRMAVVMTHFDEVMAGMLTPELRAGLYGCGTYFMSVPTPENQALLGELAALPGVHGLYPRGNGVLTGFGEGVYVCVTAFAQAANAAGSCEGPAFCEALGQVRLSAPQGTVVMDPGSGHASVNGYLGRCLADGSFEVVADFGAVAPVLPGRRRGTFIAETGFDTENEPDLDMAEIGIAYASLSGQVFHASPNFCRIVGRARTAVVAMGLPKLLFPRDPARGRRVLDELLENTTNDEWSGVLPGTGSEPVSLKVMVIRTTAGRPMSLVVYSCKGPVAADTERGAPGAVVGTAHLDPAGKLVTMDEGFLTLWELAEEGAVLGQSPAAFFEDQVAFAAALREAGPRGRQGRLMARLADGRLKPVEVSIEVLFNRKRRILGHVLTCLYRGEAQDARQALDGTTSRGILAVADIAVMALLSDGTIVQANQSAADMFGYGFEAFLELNTRALVPPHFRDRHLELLERFVTLACEGKIRHERREMTGRRREGAEFPAHVSLSLLRGGSDPVVVLTIKDISDQKRAEAHLTWQATHDSLTRLPNRALLKDRLSNALSRSSRNGLKVALLFIDLDGFKLINDSFGHALGDQLLVEMAERLLAAVRPGDTVARFGGDEFVVVCEHMSEEEAIAVLIERIVGAVRKPLHLGAQTLYATASIGVALGEGGLHTPEELLRNADATMYLAKERGRDCWRIFDDTIHQRARVELDIANGLREALERMEMEVYFQPIVHARERIIVGAELLLRWFRGDAPISPAIFVPVAERTGSILPLGAWVFEQACRVQVNLNRRFPYMPLYLSVNISARQLSDKTLVDRFRDCLAETGADPHSLLLEITESALMRDPAANRALLDDFGKLGLKLAVDDFGTGYSSLSQLMRLPVDSLKIDKAFIHEMEAEEAGHTIVSAIVKMTHALKLNVIAEGVETSEQLRLLCALGCDSIQGYYFYKPMSEAAFIEVLGKQAFPPEENRSGESG